jgi:hypothetical protein
MKKIVAVIMLISIFISQTMGVYAVQDTRILLDPVQNTYGGRTEAVPMIQNLTFNDMQGHWAHESAVRAGALGMMSSSGGSFNPNANISKQNAIAYVVRAVGMENYAVELAPAASENIAQGANLSEAMALGFLQQANQMGIITQDEFNDAIAVNQDSLNNQTNFVRQDAATREEVATWIYRGVNYVNADIFMSNATPQSIYTFADWESVDINNFTAVEAITSNGIMNGDTNGNFNPNGNVTRAEMAQILRNMDTIHHEIAGIERKRGTVRGIVDEQTTRTNEASLVRSIYIRTSQGNVDVLEYTMISNSSPQGNNRDAVVFREDRAGSLGSLQEGDEIEYLVHGESGTVLYVLVTNDAPVPRTMEGRLLEVNTEEGTITIQDANGKIFNFPLMEATYGVNEDLVNYLIIDNRRIIEPNFPIGNKVRLDLQNNVVDEITFIGQPVVTEEFRGIVIENNPQFGFLTVIDNYGNQVTKQYASNDIVVDRTRHYHNTDNELGYFSVAFPNFMHNPRQTTIDQIEVGDIVFIRLDPQNSDTIASISAVTNYRAVHATVLEVTVLDSVTTMQVRYDNGQTEWFQIPNSIFVSKLGRPARMEDILAGDRVRLLVNEATIGPGHIITSVIEITVESYGFLVSSLVKGQLSMLNPIQNTIVIQNAETLTPAGWSNHRNLQEFSIASPDIEFYHNDRRITLDYAVRHLTRAQGEVYIALESSFGGERVRKVTFRDGRDELLRADTVLHADGIGSFTTASGGNIQTDSGTIVRRHGRLVSPSNIMPSDHAVVSLNGQGRAAVVDIVETPNNDRLMVVRGRIQSVDSGRSFTVQSMSILEGHRWQFTPIEREFRIDHNTLFLNENGYVSSDTFLDYTENTVVDRVFNIIVDGSTATHVIDAGFAQESVRGTVYQINGNQVRLRNVTYLNRETGNWETISNVNNTAVVTVPQNSVVIRNNDVSTVRSLQVGHQIQVMTNQIPEVPTPGMAVNGYIIHIQN